MTISKKLRLYSAAFLCSFSALLYPIEFKAPFSCGDAAKLVAVSAVGLYSGKLIVDQIKRYIEDRLVDEVLDMLALEFTPNFQIHKLPADECEAALRKKARLINIRKRVIATLALKTQELSCEHKKNIQRSIDSFNRLFAVVDAVRRENKYENEHNIASYIDRLIESIFVNSIILRTKPESECTKQELDQRKASLEKKVRLFKKIKERGDAFILTKIASIL